MLLNKIYFHAVLKISCVTGIYPVKSVTGGQKAQIFSIKTTKMLYFHVHLTFFYLKMSSLSDIVQQEIDHLWEKQIREHFNSN